MRFYYLIFQTFICIFLQINSLSALAEQYKLIDLGFLKHEGSEVTSINDKGQICGYYLSKGYLGSYTNIFIWDKGRHNYTDVRVSMDPKINNTGQIYGSRWNWVKRGLWRLDQETIYRWETPFAYFSIFNLEDIGYPASLYSTGYVQYRTAFWDVNDAGQILTMNQKVINEKLKYEIWLYDTNHKWRRVDNAQFHAANKINNQAQLLGYFFEEVQAEKGKVKKIRAAVHHLNEGTTTLVPFAGESMGYDINDLGQVVGEFVDLEDKHVKGFFGEPKDQMTIIDNFSPKALNNQGQIIGKYLDGERKGKPALWNQSTLVDLAEVVHLVDDKGHEWQSLDALIDINERGEIIGQGVYNGKTHGFLLVPIK